MIGPAAVLYKFGSDIWIPILAQFIGAMVGAMLYDEIFRRINGPKGNQKNFFTLKKNFSNKKDFLPPKITFILKKKI